MRTLLRGLPAEEWASISKEIQARGALSASVNVHIGDSDDQQQAHQQRHRIDATANITRRVRDSGGVLARLELLWKVVMAGARREPPPRDSSIIRIAAGW